MSIYYKNKKTGKIYIFISYAKECTNSRTGEISVVYTSKDGSPEIFVREENEFNDKFVEIKESNVYS